MKLADIYWRTEITDDRQPHVGRVRKALPEEDPMPELKPCPICGAPPRLYVNDADLVHCPTPLCAMEPTTIRCWQALPRPEKGEETPELHLCRTCFFQRRGHANPPCDICDAEDQWKPDRPGDEVRIREMVETATVNLPYALRDVVESGRCLASALGVSYTDTLRARMDEATSRLGHWDVHDGRDYRREALEELLDAAMYLAAEKVREETP